MPIIPLTTLKKMAFENIVEKGENTGYNVFKPFFFRVVKSQSYVVKD